MATLQLFLGGTFNPVHIGHTRLALECHLRTGAGVAFVPCADPPHKPHPEVSIAHRLSMLELAVAELNAVVANEATFTIDRCEIEDISGPSYTFNTLHHLRRLRPQEVLVWLIGMDSLVSLHTWYRWRELTDVANLLVINRPGWQRPHEGEVAEWLSERERSLEQLDAFGGVAFLETTLVAISSTELRKQMAQGLTGKYLLPEPVQQYIQSHHLYLSH